MEETIRQLRREYQKALRETTKGLDSIRGESISAASPASRPSTR